jgi:hypothetical protein
LQPTIVFLKSPTGEVKEITVTDPSKDLVPLMSQGYHQVFLQDNTAPAHPAERMAG